VVFSSAVSSQPLHPCPHPHCGTLTRAPLCPTHRRARDQLRPSARVRGYDATWAATSRAWLSRFPWCGQRQDGQQHLENSRCAQRGQFVRATVTDHIRSLKDGGARLDPANLQSLCHACNTRKG
jgi:5-methylcytosine-specific restriction enzyme A